MKTAIYVEDGIVQLVITPEGEFEKDALKTFRDKPVDAKIFTGSFYDCRGGWVRQAPYYGWDSYGSRNEDSSLIVVARTGTQTDSAPALESSTNNEVTNT